MNKCAHVYSRLRREVSRGSRHVVPRNDAVWLAQGDFFLKILENAPPRLDQRRARVPLDTIYDAGFHAKTGAMFVCNRGAALLARAPRSGGYYSTMHLGFSIYAPGHGVEIVDVGIVGDITRGDFVVLRPESACAPSFVIGSQRCNCYDQWMLVRELAARYHPFAFPEGISDPDEFEKYVASCFSRNERGVPIARPADTDRVEPGIIFMHLISQNGMGSGADEGRVSNDLTATAYIRHRGEYTAEQTHGVTLSGGFTALGLTPDPRRLNDGIAYKLPGVILDYLGVDKRIVALTNNKDKVAALADLGFPVRRVQMLGRSDIACGVETRERRSEFSHLFPERFTTDFEHDLDRVDESIRQWAAEAASGEDGADERAQPALAGSRDD
jgi:hypothetical protein